MKTLKKWITTALTAMIALTSASCSSLPESVSTLLPFGKEEQTVTTAKVDNEYRVELANFEQWKPDFSLIRVMENFGKVSRNKDLQYVKSGKYSVKLQPTGGYYNYLKPMMYYPFASTYYNFNYEDFTYADYIEFWIYNDSDTVQSVNVGLVSDIVSQKEIKTYPSQIFYLQPKEWNLVTYYVDFSTMNITQEIKQYAMMQIKGVYFEFNSSGSIDLADSNVFYMDDLNLYYKEEENTLLDINDILQFNHKEGTDVYELCDFEHVYQKYIFSTRLGNSKSDPTISIVNAENENLAGFAATSGKNVLKVEMKGADTYQATTTSLSFSDKIVRAFYDKFVYDYDTQTPIIDASEWKNYYLAYDVYGVEGFEDDYYFGQMFFEGTNSNLTRANPKNFYVKNGEWVTYRLSLYDIANKDSTRNHTTNQNIIAAHKEYAEHYDATGGYGRRVTDAGKITFYWPEFVGENRVMYIDNLRLYKATA